MVEFLQTLLWLKSTAVTFLISLWYQISSLWNLANELDFLPKSKIFTPSLPCTSFQCFNDPFSQMASILCSFCALFKSRTLSLKYPISMNRKCNINIWKTIYLVSTKCSKPTLYLLKGFLGPNKCKTIYGHIWPATSFPSSSRKVSFVFVFCHLSLSN